MDEYIFNIEEKKDGLVAGHIKGVAAISLPIVISRIVEVIGRK